jgi:hypothetical protein
MNKKVYYHIAPLTVQILIVKQRCGGNAHETTTPIAKNGLSKRKETRFSFLVPKGKDRRQTHTILEFSNVWSFNVQHKVFVFPYFLM